MLNAAWPGGVRPYLMAIFREQNRARACDWHEGVSSLYSWWPGVTAMDTGLRVAD